MKLHIKRLITTSALSFFAFTPLALAATAAPGELAGKYGFDWLRPEKAKCAPVTAKTLTGASCKHHGTGDTGSFTGKADFYSCKVGPKSEYLIYSSQARCAEELETMQANAP
ncbi:hypothetical protein FBR05_02165 [Deltaproteobacteria bacterium PRO3]|nr:hypothetical protein [Deltaproteobacteria bacterium PRO3]